MVVGEVLLMGVNWYCAVPRVQFSVEKLFWFGSVLFTALRKFAPVTVSARSLPMVAQVGETEVTVGTGLGALFMMKVMVLERPL